MLVERLLRRNVPVSDVADKWRGEVTIVILGFLCMPPSILREGVCVCVESECRQQEGEAKSFPEPS